MKLENLRTKQLTFKDTFLYLKEVLVLNRSKFLAIFFLWFLFALLLTVIIRFSYDYIAAFSTVIAYVVFYIFYLNFIAQTRAIIDDNKISIWTSFKDVSNGFISRKGLDLLELLPIGIAILLIVFFSSSIVAVPLAFIIVLATFIFISYTIFAQPVVVIKKMKILPAVRYSINLISGSFSFVVGLIAALAFICLLLYIPCSFIKLPAFWHQFLVIFVSGTEGMFIAILITIVYTNLEVAWSVGFKSHDYEYFGSENKPENNHEFTEFFNSVPEVKIKEEDKENK